MRPTSTESLGSQRTERERPNRSPSASVAASTRGVRSEDSWVEISSQPSSSSLSSTTNDIVTTGLSIRSQREDRLSRRLRPSAHHLPNQPRASSTAGSSQDEYEESESESDRVMSSSNEDIYPAEPADDDDSSTALGVGSMGRIFTPQPNAFSHPPSSQARPIPDSYFPPTPGVNQPTNDTITQRSYQNQTQARNRPAMSSYQPDHDAALRASLTTLLSCAAAVRPKAQHTRTATATTRTSTQPTSLRLVPESELEAPPRQQRTRSPKQTKRKSRESSKERQVKKVRAANKAAMNGDDLISPTLASWMISAGVVLVFSAISFSAGYAWGREVGRLEGELGLSSTGTCSQETLRGSGTGLRRLRWGTASSSIRA